MKKSELKQLIQEVIQEVQWDRQTPEGQAKDSEAGSARARIQQAKLRKQIDAKNRADKASKILDKKPFKKPFNENWNDGAEEAIQTMDQVGKSIGAISQKIKRVTSNAARRPLAKDVKPIESEIANVISTLRSVSEKLSEIYFPKRKEKNGPMSTQDLISMDPGRSAPQGPTSGW